MYALGPVVYVLSDAVLALFFTHFRLLGVESVGVTTPVIIIIIFYLCFSSMNARGLHSKYVYIRSKLLSFSLLPRGN